MSAPRCLQCGGEFDYDPGVYHESRNPPGYCGPVENGTGPVGGWDKAQDICGGTVEVRWPKEP